MKGGETGCPRCWEGRGRWDRKMLKVLMGKEVMGGRGKRGGKASRDDVGNEAMDVWRKKET